MIAIVAVGLLVGYGATWIHRIAPAGDRSDGYGAQHAGGPDPVPPDSPLNVVASGHPPRGASAPASPRDATGSAPALPAPDSPPSLWRAAIEPARARASVVLLQAIAEERPGRDATERARLLAEVTAAIARIRTEEARRALDDLLGSPHRDLRMAAMNAAVFARSDERPALLAAWARDPDPVIRAKARALEEALR